MNNMIDKIQKMISSDNIIKNIKRVIFAGVVMIVICILIVVVTNLIMYYSVKNNIKTVDEFADIDEDIDCIVVLGAGVRDDGSPTWMLEDRILVGTELYNEQVAPKIIMSGDHGRVEYDEVNTMKQYAIDEGVLSEDVFMDHAGFSTYESMYRAKEIFGAKKIVIVTQKYHLYRAMYIAEKLGIDAYGVSADLRNYTNMQYYREFREWFARTKDFINLLFKPEPTFLGESIDLHGSGDVTNDK